MLDNEKTKMCKKCGELKPLNANYFEKNEQCKDGFIGTCRDCRKQQARAARNKKYAGSPVGAVSDKKQVAARVTAPAAAPVNQTKIDDNPALETLFYHALADEGLTVAARVLARYMEYKKSGCKI